MRIAFLDTVGLKYNGDTLNKKGLGGSESAIIYLTQELAKLGHEVTAFIRLEGEEAYYNGVHYVDNIRASNNVEKFDVLISSRSCVPFIPVQYRVAVLKETGYDILQMQGLVTNSKFKVVWLHDCFLTGDNWFEGLLVDGLIDEVFTLSDWQTSYISNGHIWRGRIYEVMKQKIFQTRNGAKQHLSEIDITQKDRNSFVFNASISKGMRTLVEFCWPKIKEKLPDAKLTIIGGYYFGAGFNQTPDEQEIAYFELVKKYGDMNGITFTGVIKQNEIAEILSKAYLTVYPAAHHPETFSISVLESLLYNTPVVSTRFGAIEETAIEQASYIMNYGIDALSKVKTDTNGKVIEYTYDENQINRFVNLVVNAYNDTYLWQQKAYACNELKEWVTWETVARQWEEHLSKKTDNYLSLDKQKRVRRINREVNRIFRRRFVNSEDVVGSIAIDGKQQKFVIVSPMYDAEKYIAKCINSVANQYYDNYHMYIVDDMSTDNSYKVALDTISALPVNLQGKFTVILNTEKSCALGNQIKVIEKYRSDDDIIVLLDGDDWLFNDSDIFNYLNTIYADGAEMTYGSCYSLCDNINLISQPYPKKVHEEKSYRQHNFNWGMPYSHLRTFKKSLYKKIDKKLFKDENGKYWEAGGDNALFYPLFENTSEDKIKCIQRILMVYNDRNPKADRFVHTEEQNINAKKIRGQDKKDLTQPLQNVNYKVIAPDEEIVVENKVKKDLGQALYDVHAKVMEHDGEAIAEHKDILQKRDQVWIDNTNATNIAPRRDWIIRKLASLYAKPDSKILDIGAWTGALANDIRKAGYDDITCLDISDRCVEEGKKAFPYFNWVRADIENFIITVKFDYIIMGEIVEHLADPYGTIERLRGNLTENGAILFTIPTAETVFGQTENSALEHIVQIKEEDIRRYSEDLEILPSQEFFNWYVGSIKSNTKDEIMGDKKIRVLIAYPTARDIETASFLSVYNLDVPNNVETELECFYGYNIDQVRNLIASYGIGHKFDYIFFVDSDIILPKNALRRLLESNKDIITGVYIQRKPNVRIPEIYVENQHGGMHNIDISEVQGNKVFRIGGCGFGCVLVKTNVLEKVGYPQFEYHDTLDIKETLSEDVDFALKAKQKGFELFVDTSVKCEHLTNIRLCVS